MSLAEIETDVVTAQLVAPSDAGRRIAERVEQSRRTVVRTRTVTRWLLALATGLALCGLWALIDYRLEMAWLARAVGLIGIIAGTVLVARRGLPRWTQAYRLEDVACDVERHLTQFGQRLRTTLDYQTADERDPRRPAPAEPKLLRSLEDETYELSAAADFDVVIDSRPMLVALAVAGGLFLAWLIGLVMYPEWRIAAGRTLLFPWHYTTVEFEPHDATIKVGESLTVLAKVAGRPVDSALVRFRPVGSEEAWSELELTATEDEAGKFQATLADCREDLEFDVLAGPVPLPRGHVRVLQPLTIEKFQARITPPQYTRKPATETDQWVLKVFEGSHIEFTVGLNRAAQEARLTRLRKPEKSGSAAGAAANAKPTESAESADAPPEKSETVELVASGPELHGQFRDLRDSGVWELTARTADGIDLEPQRLTVRVQLDGRAKIRFLEPSEELEVIATAEVPFVVEAADDLALVRIGIGCQVADGPMQVLWQEEYGEGSSEVVRGTATVRLEDYRLTYQDGVTYYAFADDRYFDDERRTATPLRFIDIRPFKMAYQMLDTGGT